MNIDGSVCLVTGGAKGLGLEIATNLKGQGANVVIADLDGNALFALDDQFQCYTLDVTNPDDARKTVKDIIEKSKKNRCPCQ